METLKEKKQRQEREKARLAIEKEKMMKRE